MHEILQKKKRTFLKKSSVDQLDFSIYFLLPQHFLASLILFAAVSNRSFSPPSSPPFFITTYIHTCVLVAYASDIPCSVTLNCFVYVWHRQHWKMYVAELFFCKKMLFGELYFVQG
jgi:hypothetical protein